MTTKPVQGKALVGRSYTRSRRQPRMFGRMPGRDGAYVPGGPYTLTQGVLFLALLLIVWKLPIFDWLGSARWFVPLSAVFVRRARIESRTPAGWLLGLCTQLLAPTTGTVEGKPYRPSRPVWSQQRIYLHHNEGPGGPQPSILASASATEAVSPLQLLLIRARSASENEVF
ncbi:hypothetical protein [Amycolatopsis sp. NPDC059657]|uniref:hypothetical protein n=1 Tax=Amycolatopsis sp. NPDC059657 TaxID=3346899 RepID=UPI00366DE615